MGNEKLFSVHCIDLCLIVLVQHTTLDFQCIGQFATLHGERLGKEGETLHLLVMGKLLLQGLYTLHQHLTDTLVVTQILARVIGNIVLTGISLEQLVFGHDESRDELTLISNNGYLVDVLVNQEFRLYHLWGDILTVRGLEKVLYTVFQEEFTILHITRVASAEVALLGEGLARDIITVVIAAGYGWTLQQYLTLLADLDVDALDGVSYRAYLIGLAQMVAGYSSQTLCETVSHHHIDADAMNELLNMRRDGSTSRGEEMGILKSQFLADK